VGRKISVIVIFALLLPGSKSVFSQENDKPKSVVGQKVKVKFDTTVSKKEFLVIPYTDTEKREVFGELVFWDSDSLVVENFEYGFRKTVLSDDLKGVYVNDGADRSWFTGGAVGAGIGSFGSWSRNNPVRALFAIVGGCTITGAITGWFIKKDHWRKVEQNNSGVQLSTSFSAKNTYLSISLRF
jgi:hypothetical protein